MNSTTSKEQKGEGMEWKELSNKIAGEILEAYVVRKEAPLSELIETYLSQALTSAYEKGKRDEKERVNEIIKLRYT